MPTTHWTAHLEGDMEGLLNIRAPMSVLRTMIAGVATSPTALGCQDPGCQGPRSRDRVGTARGTKAATAPVRSAPRSVPGRAGQVGAGPAQVGPGQVEPAAIEHGAPSLEELYRREYHSVVALAYALTGRGAVAEELAQDAFVATYRNWDRVAAYSSPGAYVRRVVANMSFSTRRRWQAEARALARMAARAARWEPPTAEHDAEFWQGVRSLPPRQAQALALRYLEDRSDTDIAEILGCSEPTVRVHLHNARVSLAGRLTATPGAGAKTKEASR